MKYVSQTSRNRRGERGAAVVLLLFAMSAFSVLATAALTTNTMREAPSGSVYGIASGVRDGERTKFVAPLVVPNEWRLQGGNGSYAFELPVLVPEQSSENSGATAAWHTMSDLEVPGMTVCCESSARVCAARKQENGVAVADWTPTADDAQWLSFELGHQPDASGKSDLVTATLRAAAAQADAEGTALACQFEFQGNIVAKGYARLRAVPQQSGAELPADAVEGTMDVAVRTR